MSLRPRAPPRRASAHPAPAGAPVRGSLHGAAIGLKPGVVLPPAPKPAFRAEPEPTEAVPTKDDVSKYANEKRAQAAKLAAQASDRAGKAARATQKAATEAARFNKAARDILDDIESEAFFEMQPEFRARDRERFAEAVIDKATGRAVFGFITEAQITELLQVRKDAALYKSEKWYEYNILQTLVNLAYKTVVADMLQQAKDEKALEAAKKADDAQLAKLKKQADAQATTETALKAARTDLANTQQRVAEGRGAIRSMSKKDDGVTKANLAALEDNPDVAFEVDEADEPAPMAPEGEVVCDEGFEMDGDFGECHDDKGRNEASKAKGAGMKAALASNFAAAKKPYEEAGFDPATLPPFDDWPGWEAYRITDDRERAYVQEDGTWYYLVAQYNDDGDIVNYADPGSPPSTPTGGADAPKEEEKEEQKGDPQYDWIGDGMRAKEAEQKKMAKEDCDLPCQLQQQRSKIMEKKKGESVKSDAPLTGLAAKLAKRRASLEGSDDEE